MKTPTTTRSLLRDRNFQLFWSAQGISRFGDPITLVVLAYVAYVRTGSALLTAVAVLITTVPPALFGLFGGALADSFGHRRAMVLSDALRAALIVLLGVLATAGAPLWALYVIVFAAGLCGAVFNPARFAAVPTLLGERRLDEANALFVSTDRATEILGSLAAGILVVLLGPTAFFVDAATFGLSAVLLTQLRTDDRRQEVSLARLVDGATAGVAAIRASRPLFANTVFSLLAQLSLPVANGLTPVLLIRRFADGDAAVGAAEFAVAEATLALGAVFGGIFVHRIGEIVGKGALLIGGFVFYGASVVALAVAPTLTIAFVAVGLMGVANVFFYVPNVTAAQQLTSPPLRARVIGARIALLNLTWLPVTAATGALADILPTGLLLGAAGAFTILVALVGASVRVVREVP